MSQALLESVQGSAKRTLVTIVLAGGPFVLLVLLAVLNPRYLATFLDESAVGIGLPLLLVIVFVTVIAYPAAIGGSAAVYHSGRRVLGIVLAFLAFTLICLPAAVVLLLGPAALSLATIYQR